MVDAGAVVAAGEGAGDGVDLQRSVVVGVVADLGAGLGAFIFGVPDGAGSVAILAQVRIARLESALAGGWPETPLPIHAGRRL